MTRLKFLYFQNILLVTITLEYYLGIKLDFSDMEKYNWNNPEGKWNWLHDLQGKRVTFCTSDSDANHLGL